MSIDIRKTIVDTLEKHCKKKDIKFLWSMERSPEGALTIHFKKDNNRFSRRISYTEIESVKFDVGTIIKTVTKEISHW